MRFSNFVKFTGPEARGPGKGHCMWCALFIISTKNTANAWYPRVLHAARTLSCSNFGKLKLGENIEEKSTLGKK